MLRYLTLVLVFGCGVIDAGTVLQAAEGSPAEQQLAAAATAQQYAYLMFFRQEDEATKSMRAAITARSGPASAGTSIGITTRNPRSRSS